jgi:pimeloyl-ACP methyl ester carboxylesterase
VVSGCILIRTAIRPRNLCCFFTAAPDASGDWVYAGRDEFVKHYRLIAPDARGHGRSTNPDRAITPRQNALDVLALLDHLGVAKCKAVGMSFGGNTLLHVATREPGRIEAMALISPTMHFPEQARALLRQMHAAEKSPQEWETMRGRHKLGGRSDPRSLGLDGRARRRS